MVRDRSAFGGIDEGAVRAHHNQVVVRRPQVYKDLINAACGVALVLKVAARVYLFDTDRTVAIEQYRPCPFAENRAAWLRLEGLHGRRLPQ